MADVKGNEKRIGRFDVEAFHAGLDAERRSRGITWQDVAAGAGISASTLTRMGQGYRPDVDGAASLAAWSGLSLDDYVRATGERPRPSGPAEVSACIHRDENLSGDAAALLDAIVNAVYAQLKDRETRD